ncbi:hypothetical protein BATDEDRAFT_24411 [Batrachochytrium dendrobatidis JAM81]|uniref:Uncharacterized protein n=1 Tax=Batrachochytrium dendrobatidis (strain JAM81 / FGSC 10211) TaxID=684364 RepID=F4P1G7_BATDJ|nr:uncharacterized protein BATDEDRAFT_24411 [Batrachochytrium dendrobatidis JAM81]EGF80635.1 hypothetical protein BATDEDRAFT_24411 [Batrachochytrium dendrobatidis JAM81]|eukprot:XP_006678447.1 hypothetical protein BATDEDRAFT_24411 [Batrachochytrium dendrobatidis JAM81]
MKMKPKYIDLFEIRLPSTHIILPRGFKQADFHAVAKSNRDTGQGVELNGSVVLKSLVQLDRVQAIQVRFVGCIISKHDTNQCSLRGSERLFDQKITLFEGNHQTSLLGSITHVFDFTVRVPSYMPASTSTSHMQVEYLLVAAVHFEHGCCGLLPLFSQDSIVTRQEVIIMYDWDIGAEFEQLVKVYGQRLICENKEKSNGKEKPMLGLCSIQVDSALEIGSSTYNEGVDDQKNSTPFWIIWTPSSYVLARFPPSMSSHAMNFPIKVVLAKNWVPIHLNWSITQMESYEFWYTINDRKMDKRVFDKGECCRNWTNTIASGVVKVFGDGKMNLKTDEVEYHVDLSFCTSDIELVVDIKSKIANVSHLLHLDLEVETKDADLTLIKNTFDLICPICVIKPVNIHETADQTRQFLTSNTEDIFEAKKAAPAAEVSDEVNQSIRNRSRQSKAVSNDTKPIL